ncbi:MAG TPA: GMC family oxidoreductase N-terminal domain-containing protein, partial [Thermoanaerobaculia bacterium]|nr:GMC family oxidoreductase N-terminal domain-containing protein [Thermoanaerobaculia bacterium]
RELEMAPALYEDEGGFLTAEGTMTLAFGRALGGSTVVYTGTSMQPPERVIRGWGVPGLAHADLDERAKKYAAQNNVHFLPQEELNDNNRLFVEGCRNAGYHAEQFPINVKGCRGTSLCNLGCPVGAKQGTDRVQIPEAERAGVEVVTRAEALRLEERAVLVRVGEKKPGSKGLPSEWAPGEYRIHAGTIVLAGGAVGSPALLLRSRLAGLPRRIGEGFTCHPAHILAAEHARPITNDVGHPKSFFLDRAVEEKFVLETCMYFPFTTAKNLAGFGAPHSTLMHAYPRLQMILVLACDKAVPGNRVGVDRDGKPVVHYRFTRETIEALVRATRASARIFFGAGALRVHAPSANPPLIEAKDAARIDELIDARHFKPGKISVSAAHLMGGCGMGRDAADSVTDARGIVHGRPWLRVADSSLFPDSLEINPYLTIMALADRVAEGVLQDAGALAVAGGR